jgi:hypothetical protein
MTISQEIHQVFLEQKALSNEINPTLSVSYSTQEETDIKAAIDVALCKEGTLSSGVVDRVIADKIELLKDVLEGKIEGARDRGPDLEKLTIIRDEQDLKKKQGDLIKYCIMEKQVYLSIRAKDRGETVAVKKLIAEIKCIPYEIEYPQSHSRIRNEVDNYFPGSQQGVAGFFGGHEIALCNPEEYKLAIEKRFESYYKLFSDQDCSELLNRLESALCRGSVSDEIINKIIKSYLVDHSIKQLQANLNTLKIREYAMTSR